MVALWHWWKEYKLSLLVSFELNSHFRISSSFGYKSFDYEIQTSSHQSFCLLHCEYYHFLNDVNVN